MGFCGSDEAAVFPDISDYLINKKIIHRNLLSGLRESKIVGIFQLESIYFFSYKVLFFFSVL